MKFAVLDQNSPNIGDDIQNYAVARLLKEEFDCPDPVVIHRERLAQYDGEPVILPLCSWMKYKWTDWPPSSAIRPVFVGTHLNNRFPGDLKGVEFGGRDIPSVKLARKHGADAYLSGCITSTLEYYDDRIEEDLGFAIDIPPESAIVAIDVGDFDAPRSQFAYHHAKVCSFTHQMKNDKFPRSVRFNTVKQILRRIAASDLVITTRLHAMLPALAMEKEVIYLGPKDRRTNTYLRDCYPNGAPRRQAFIRAIESARCSA